MFGCSSRRSTAPYDIHFDDAPSFYVNGKPRLDRTAVRQLEP